MPHCTIACAPYSHSAEALSLGWELRERVTRRLFQPPKIGAQDDLPALWRARYATPPGMDELFAFCSPPLRNLRRSAETSRSVTADIDT